MPQSEDERRQRERFEREKQYVQQHGVMPGRGSLAPLAPICTNRPVPVRKRTACETFEPVEEMSEVAKTPRTEPAVPVAEALLALCTRASSASADDVV
jgi:hypothetical protein